MRWQLHSYRQRGFSAEDFALSHPGGALGKRLLLKIDELYHHGSQLPVISAQATISEALIEVTEKSWAWILCCG